MKKFIIIAILSHFGVTLTKIIEITDLAEISPHIDGDNTLIIFDVDDTLVKADKTKLKEIEPLIEELPELNTKNLKLKWFLAQASQKNLKQIINELQERGRVIALTQCNNLKPFYKLYQIDKIGLDFNKAFPNCPLIELEASKGKAIFDNGVACCGKNNKGEVLFNFLQKINYRPSEIIFADDKLHNLINVEYYMQQLKIPVTSFWYTRVKKN